MQNIQQHLFQKNFRYIQWDSEHKKPHVLGDAISKFMYDAHWFYARGGMKEKSERGKEHNSINLSITSICSETQNFKESLWIGERLRIDTEKPGYPKLHG